MGLWSIAGERQSQKFRVKYVRAILSQEVGWFDTCGAAQLSTRVADLTGKVCRVPFSSIGDRSHTHQYTYDEVYLCLVLIAPHHIP